VNDADRWRGELLSPENDPIVIRGSAILDTSAPDSAIEMKTSPLISCGEFTYVILRSASDAQPSIDAFVFSDYPINRLASAKNIAPPGDTFISSTCVPASSEQSNGIILLMRKSDGGRDYTLFLDSALTPSPEILEDELVVPEQPNVNFVITSLQVLDSTQATRLIFGYDKTQPQSANGALLGFFQPNPDTVASVLDQNTVNACPSEFYLSNGDCVACDGSDEALLSCAARSESRGSSDSLPAPIKVAIGVLIPFILLFIAFLAYVWWRQRQEPQYGKKRGRDILSSIKSDFKSSLEFLKNGTSKISLTSSQNPILQQKGSRGRRHSNSRDLRPSTHLEFRLG
jgi:hypothetical protein